MEDQEKVEIVIDETPEVEEEQEFSIEGLTPQEIELAKSHNLIKEKKEEVVDGDDTEQSEPETEEDSGEEEKEEGVLEEVDTDPKDFESMDKVFDKDEKVFHKKFTPNQKALYFKYKDEKTRRQELQRESEEKLAALELDKLKDSVNKKKIDRLNRLLAEEADNLTIEKLQAVINGEEKTEDDSPITRSELERIEKEREQKLQQQQKAQENFNRRVELANKIGKSRYDNFDDIANLANEVVKEDTTGTYQRIIGELFINNDVDEEKIVDRVVTVAQLHPKFKEVVSQASPEDKEKVNRAITNSKKRVSSASISSSGKRVVTSEDDLTVDDVVKMSVEQWSKLKPSTRKRLLMGS